MTTATAELPLDDLYARELPELATPWRGQDAPAPGLVVLNRPLAQRLGLDPDVLASPEGLAVLAGGAVPEGATPVAMGYAGHQFGNFSPRLGDGRAVLLGEVVTDDGQRHDLHLKGSGRTPWARGGDGRATLGSMLREHLLAEAMHALGVPTTRSLAVVTTGEDVLREQGLQPGAVLTRTATSHLRVGTFQYAALREQHGEDEGLLRRLADHAIVRHRPDVTDADDRYVALLAHVVEVQAALVARWMQLGFIHGVMNTDNTTISGETIDYGPCAFMDRFDPSTVYSSIDHGGRYAYGNQPSIAQWNLVRLAEAMLPLLGDDREAAVAAANDVVRRFPGTYRRHFVEGMRSKLGLVEAHDGDGALVDALLDWLHAGHVDFTGAFRALAAALRDDWAPLDAIATSDPAQAWLDRWRRRLADEGRDRAAVAAGMDGVNPVYVPRNHLVEEALAAAVDGDLAPFHRLLALVTNPFDEQPDAERHALPAPPAFDERYRTFCGT